MTRSCSMLTDHEVGSRNVIGKTELLITYDIVCRQGGFVRGDNHAHEVPPISY